MLSRNHRPLQARAAAVVIIILAMGAALTACPGFAPKPVTFNERTAAGLASVTYLRDTATSLLATDTISTDDAQNVQDIADVGRTGIDVARRLKATDPGAADAKLQATMLILNSARSYLICRETGRTDCRIEATP